MSKILEWAKTAEHCQRNWLNLPVQPSDIDTIVEACTTMPTKQNELHYELVVVTDPWYRAKVAKYAVETIDSKGRTYPSHGNPQMLSPLQLLWFTTKHSVQDRKDASNSIGISSAAASLCAQELGLRTGFCACARGDIILELFADCFDRPKHLLQLELMMGIGYADPQQPYNSWRGGTIKTHPAQRRVHRR